MEYPRTNFPVIITFPPSPDEAPFNQITVYLDYNGEKRNIMITIKWEKM